MPELLVSCRLPAGIYLPNGRYGENADTALLIDSEIILADGRPEGRVRAYMEEVKAPENLDAEAMEKFKREQANVLLRRVNSLIRWLRHATKSALISEMTLVQASPIMFQVVVRPFGRLGPADLITGRPRWGMFEADADAIHRPRGGITDEELREIRQGYGSDKEPPTESILLLDATAALHGGRFREAVLLSWSAIDSTFNVFYGHLADRQLAGEWSEGIRFIKGIDFGLRQKMTVGLRLLGCSSLFAEPEDFWMRLSESYTQRNRIIHEGQTAAERDARLAVSVAGKLVNKVHRLAQDQNINIAS